MQIQNFDALKGWLTNYLTPICDAEPAALAKYVIALLKKEKTDEELRRICLEQLDVFLQENTIKFVATLFEVIANENYLDTSDKEKISEQVVDVTQSKDSNKSKSRFNTTNKDKDDKARSGKGLSSSKRHRSRSPVTDSHRSNKRSERGRLERDHNRRGSHRSHSPVCEAGTLISVNSDASKASGNLADNTQLKAIPIDSGITQKARCRDFHEKGFCMRGDLCSFDHGIDPVVVEDMSKVIGYPTPDQTPVIDTRFICQPIPNAQSLICASQVPFVGSNTCPVNEPVSVAFMPSKRNVLTVPIIDDSSTCFVQAMQPLHRDISLSQMDLRNTLNNSANCNSNRGTSTRGLRVAPNNRLDPQNCTLYIMRVPQALNNVGKLFEHFAKFGNIANIQVNPNSEADTALVTFSSHQEALSAYRSPEPIFANRFIRVAFYDHSRLPGNQSRQSHRQAHQQTSLNLDGDVGVFAGVKTKEDSSSSIRQISSTLNSNPAKLERKRTGASHSTLAGRLGNRVSVKQRLGVLPSRSSALLDSSDEEAAKAAEDSVRRPRRQSLRSDDADVFDKLVSQNNVEPIETKKPPPSQPVVSSTVAEKAQRNDRNTLRQAQQQMQQQLRLQKELRVKQVSLLQVYRKQMAALVVKLEKALTAVDKRRIAADVKAVNIKVRDLEKELKLNKKTPMQPQPISKKEAQRQILDLEMEIYQKELSHESVTVLKKRLLELKRLVGSSLNSSMVSINTASVPSQLRLPTASQTRLDKRPRVLYISGYEENQYNSLLNELAVSGLRVTCKQEIVEGIPVAVVVFGSRAEAEQAFVQFQTFNGQALKLEWLPPKLPSKELLNFSTLQADSNHETSKKSAFKDASSDTDEDDQIIVSTNTCATAALVSNRRLSSNTELSTNLLETINNEHVAAS